MKHNINDCDKIWKIVDYIDSISDGISVDNSEGNSEGFTVGTYYDATLGLIDSTVLGVADSSKFVK